MDLSASTLFLYICFASVLIGWVANTNYRLGHRFLLEVFGNEEDAEAVGRMRLVSFFLVNLGFVLLTVFLSGEITDSRGAMVSLSWRLGLLMLLLGVQHSLNLSSLRAMVHESRRDALRELELRASVQLETRPPQVGPAH